MTKKNGNSLIYDETKRIVKSGERDLDVYKKNLFYSFFPNNYEQFYDRIPSLLLHKHISKEIVALKKYIQSEILLLIQPDEIHDTSVEKLEQNIDLIKYYRTLEMSLSEMKYKILTHQIAHFVDVIKKKWTLFDMIGYIEKLEYDKTYGRYSGVQFDDLSIYIKDIKRVFDERYLAGAYDKVEKFRQAYIEQNNTNSNISSCDYVFRKDEYIAFMHALKIAMKKNDFYTPDSTYFSTMKQAAMSLSKLKKDRKD